MLIHLTDLSMLITHRFNILAVVPRTSRLCHTSQISLPNIHFFAIASSIALLTGIYELNKSLIWKSSKLPYTIYSIYMHILIRTYPKGITINPINPSATAKDVMK